MKVLKLGQILKIVLLLTLGLILKLHLCHFHVDCVTFSSSVPGTSQWSSHKFFVRHAHFMHACTRTKYGAIRQYTKDIVGLINITSLLFFYVPLSFRLSSI
jgi:hypothetical protein